MTSIDTAMGRIVRCPKCLERHRVADEMDAAARVQCSACGKRFDLLHAQRANSIPSDRQSPPPYLEPPKASYGSIIWSTTGLAIAGSLAGSYYYIQQMDGPEFLAFYAVCLVGTLIGSTMLRHMWSDSYLVSTLAMIVFEGIGLIRYVTGVQQGMHKFGFMFAMMIIGGLLFFVRAKEDRGYGFFGGCGVGCGGAGCGGGGCGGGGCGGCGGD